MPNRSQFYSVIKSIVVGLLVLATAQGTFASVHHLNIARTDPGISYGYHAILPTLDMAEDTWSESLLVVRTSNASDLLLQPTFELRHTTHQAHRFGNFYCILYRSLQI